MDSAHALSFAALNDRRSKQKPELTILVIGEHDIDPLPALTEVQRQSEQRHFTTETIFLDAALSSDVTSIVRSHPSTRCIIPARPFTRHQAITTGITESRSPFVYVLPASALMTRFSMPVFTASDRARCFMLAPQQFQDGASLPVVAKGYLVDDIFSLEHTTGVHFDLTLQMPDGIGIYRRDAFLRLGGFYNGFRHFNAACLDLCYRAYAAGLYCAITDELAVERRNGMNLDSGDIDMRDRLLFHFRNILSPRYRSISAFVLSGGHTSSEVITALGLMRLRGTTAAARRTRAHHGIDDDAIMLFVRANVLH